MSIIMTSLRTVPNWFPKGYEFFKLYHEVFRFLNTSKGIFSQINGSTKCSFHGKMVCKGKVYVVLIVLFVHLLYKNALPPAHSHASKHGILFTMAKYCAGFVGCLYFLCFQIHDRSLPCK